MKPPKPAAAAGEPPEAVRGRAAAAPGKAGRALELDIAGPRGVSCQEPALLERRAPSMLGKNCYMSGMALTSRILAAGPGWSVGDIVCTSGPHDRSYEERHDCVSIGAVTEGTFQYRTATGAALLAPGSLLLGNHGAPFECGHEHGTGDRCLAFQFSPEFMESVAAAVPGARRLEFAVPHLPPRASLVPLLAAAEAARDDGEAGEIAELAL